MARIKITEKQAKLLENLNKGKVIKITEKQLHKILESEKLGEGAEIPQITKGISKVSPSDAIQFKHNINTETKFKNVIHEDLWKEFVNELYGLNESGPGKYDKLIKLMETLGYVENRKLSKVMFEGNKDFAKNVILGGLNKMNESGSPYMAMEAMEKTYDEILKSLKSQLNQPPSKKFTQDEIDEKLKQIRQKELELRKKESGEIREIDGEEVQPTDEVDTITMDVPLFLRSLEYSREDAQSDLSLHDITQKAIELNKLYPVLNMDNYYEIFGGDDITTGGEVSLSNHDTVNEENTPNGIVGLDILNHEPFSRLPETRREMGDYKSRMELSLPSIDVSDAKVIIYSKSDLIGHEFEGPKMVHKFDGYILGFKNKFGEEPIFVDLKSDGTRFGGANVSNQSYLDWKRRGDDAKLSYLSGERTAGRTSGLDELEINSDINKKNIDEAKLGAGYTHFAIFKDSGKIADGWDYSTLYDKYTKTYDNTSIREHTKMDLKDNYPENKLSDFKIVTRQFLEKNKINPSDTNNWYKIGMDEVTAMGGASPVFSGPGGFPVGKLSSSERKIYETLSDFKKKVEEEAEEEVEDIVDEATTTTSVGNIQYATPGFASSDFFGNSKKKGKAPVNKGVTHKKTTIPGGKFVEFDDCTKLNNNKSAQEGKCSVGAVDGVVKLKEGEERPLCKIMSINSTTEIRDLLNRSDIPENFYNEFIGLLQSGETQEDNLSNDKDIANTTLKKIQSKICR
jgi:hypothetical protein